jgi:hypothetical protein
VSETRVIRGRWWLADKADKSGNEGVPGTLILSDEEFRLELEGTLLTDPALRRRVADHCSSVPVDRILGETTERRQVTLERCDLAQIGTSAVRDRETREYESYWPHLVCFGGWFLDEAIAFDRVFVRLSSLHPWTAVSGFDPRWLSLPVADGETVSQSYTPPHEQRAELHDGTIIKLSFPLEERAHGLYTFEKTLTQATRFVFEFPQPREVESVQTLVFTLRNFLTLAVGEAVKVTQLVGHRKPLPTDELPVGRSVEIIYQHLENPRAREVSNHHDMVFLLPDIAENFEEHMVRWFDRAPELGRVLDLYFSTLHAGFVYLETRFMNFAQAIEGYHRRRLNRLMYDEETFVAQCEAILDNVAGSTRRLAKRALRHANEISLEDRIKDVLQLLGDPATSIVAAGRTTPGDFAKRAAAIRNVYAHNLQSEEPEHLELVVFAYQLKALVEALLLHEIGFEPRAIDKMLLDAGRYQLIQSMEG